VPHEHSVFSLRAHDERGRGGDERQYVLYVHALDRGSLISALKCAMWWMVILGYVLMMPTL